MHDETNPKSRTHRSLYERRPVELARGVLLARAVRGDLVPRERLPLGLGRAAALAVSGRPGRLMELVRV